MAIKTEVTSNKMFERYKNRLILRTADLKRTLTGLLQILGDLDVDLEKRKLIIDKYATYTLRQLKTKRSENVLRFLKFSKYDDAIEIELIKQLIKDRIHTVNSIERIQNEIEILQKFIVTKDIFKYVLKQFNTAMINKVIETGYTWNLGVGLGTMSIAITNRVPPANGLLPINWKDTKEEKQKLLDKGVEIFNMEYCPDGQEYLKFFTEPFSVWFYWNKNASTTTNIVYYAFKPIKGENNIVSQLQQHWRKDNSVLRKYNFKTK